MYFCFVFCGEMIYILWVIGDLMIDEYCLGDMIFVDFEVFVCYGDDVIVLMYDIGEIIFKRLIEDGI